MKLTSKGRYAVMAMADLAKSNDIKVIECNLRASRSFPFASKTLELNLINLATQAILDKNTKSVNISIYHMDYVCIKCPIFSFKRLKDFSLLDVFLILCILYITPNNKPAPKLLNNLYILIKTYS